jgi:phosphoribosylanthranilate isomerase
MRVKICGITNVDDALLCTDLGADALGFIFYNKSKRNISVKSAGEIINRLPSFISKVGVFVEQSPEEILSIANNIGLNAVQIHSDNTNLNPEGLPVRIIKAIRVKPGFDFTELQMDDKFQYLFDSYLEKIPGGTGETFDWNLIPDNIVHKIILAGGISGKNIGYVFENIKPQAVDLSSSVESEPGRKDKNKIKDFFDIVNRLRYRC